MGGISLSSFTATAQRADGLTVAVHALLVTVALATCIVAIRVVVASVIIVTLIMQLL